MSTPLPLVPGTLDVDCYPASAQQLYEEMFAKGSATSPGVTGILIQDNPPDPIDRGAKGWVPTSGNVPKYPGYVFVWHAIYGHWVSRHPKGPSDPRPEMYIGDPANLPTFDGGDAGAPTAASGPMWELWTAIDGRVPVGVGTIPGAVPATTVGALATSDSQGNSGEYEHILTEAEGAMGNHVHPFGVSNLDGSNTSDDAYFNYVTPIKTVAGYSGFYVTGSDGFSVTALTQANLYTLKADDNAGVVSDPHNNMQPYIGVYWIKRTTREFFVEG